MNDLPNIKIIRYLFANDTNIYYEDESFENLESKVNKELRSQSMA